MGCLHVLPQKTGRKYGCIINFIQATRKMSYRPLMMAHRADLLSFMAELKSFMAEMASYIAEMASYMAEMASYMAEMASYIAEMASYMPEMMSYTMEMKSYTMEMASYMMEMKSYMAELMYCKMELMYCNSNMMPVSFLSQKTKNDIQFVSNLCGIYSVFCFLKCVLLIWHITDDSAVCIPGVIVILSGNWQSFTGRVTILLSFALN